MNSILRVTILASGIFLSNSAVKAMNIPQDPFALPELAEAPQGQQAPSLLEEIQEIGGFLHQQGYEGVSLAEQLGIQLQPGLGIEGSFQAIAAELADQFPQEFDAHAHNG